MCFIFVYVYLLSIHQLLSLSLSLSLYFHLTGDWELAQQQYEHLMSGASASPLAAREAEYKLWEERWVHCTTQLGQNDVLLRVAEETRSADLMVHAAWRMRSWKKLKETLTKVFRRGAEREQSGKTRRANGVERQGDRHAQ